MSSHPESLWLSRGLPCINWHARFVKYDTKHNICSNCSCRRGEIQEDEHVDLWKDPRFGDITSSLGSTGQRWAGWDQANREGGPCGYKKCQILGGRLNCRCTFSGEKLALSDLMLKYMYDWPSISTLRNVFYKYIGTCKKRRYTQGEHWSIVGSKKNDQIWPKCLSGEEIISCSC